MLPFPPEKMDPPPEYTSWATIHLKYGETAVSSLCIEERYFPLETSASKRRKGSRNEELRVSDAAKIGKCRHGCRVRDQTVRERVQNVLRGQADQSAFI